MKESNKINKGFKSKLWNFNSNKAVTADVEKIWIKDLVQANKQKIMIQEHQQQKNRLII